MADKKSDWKAPEGTRIGHTHLTVGDIDRSLSFYCGILGFELTARYGNAAAFISAGGYHHHIGLNTWQGEGVPPQPQGYAGLYHHAILYPTRHALATVLRRLMELGYPMTGFSDHGVSEALYLNDPDGIGVELYFDRPTEEWPRNPDGTLAMGSAPLDLADLLSELEENK